MAKQIVSAEEGSVVNYAHVESSANQAAVQGTTTTSSIYVRPVEGNIKVSESVIDIKLEELKKSLLNEMLRTVQIDATAYTNRLLTLSQVYKNINE